MKHSVPITLIVLMTVVSFGCDRKTQQEPGQQPAERERPAGQPAASKTLGDARTRQKPVAIITEKQLEAALVEKNPHFQGEIEVGGDGRNILAVAINDPAIEDIGPLTGLPLRQLDLTGCRITDVSPLKGMPLRILYLGETGVEDIGVLQGMPLVELFLNHTRVADLSPLQGAALLQRLNLEGSRVSNLSPLRGMRRLEMLWLTGCPVKDISPLRDVPSLVSLTVADTKLSDLGPLKGHPLQRLHIANTAVTDLSPLQSMRLTRLIFTPSRIKTGIQFARSMSMDTLREIDVDFNPPRRPMSPAEFWPRYDAGEFD